MNTYLTTCNWEEKVIRVLSVDIPDGFQWITSFSEFKSKRFVNGKIHPRSIVIYTLLLDIQSFLDKEFENFNDPIKYLLYLYYDPSCLLSISDIERRLTEILGENYPYKWKNSREQLRKKFVMTFGWELRDPSEQTPTRTAKNSHKKPELNSFRSEKTKQLVDAYQSKLNDVLIKHNNEENQFSQKDFDSRKGKLRKYIYLLSLEFKLSEENTLDLIKQLCEATWTQTIANQFNLVLKWYSHLHTLFPLDENNIQYIYDKIDNSSLEKKQISLITPVNIEEISWYNTTFSLEYSLHWFHWISSMWTLSDNKKLGYLEVKFLTLQKILNSIYSNRVDPIQYFIYRYYQKDITVEMLSNKVQELWMYWPSKTLYDNLKALGWSLNAPNNPSINTRMRLWKAKRKTNKKSKA